MGTASHTVAAEGALATAALTKMFNNYVMVAGTLTLSSSYATGGDTLDLSKFLSTTPVMVLLGTAKTAYHAEWVVGTTAANGKVKVYSQLPGLKTTVAGTQTGPASYPTGGATLDLSGTLSATPDGVVVNCTGAFTASYVAGNAANNGKIKVIALSSDAEVANATNLSSQTFTYVAYGSIASHEVAATTNLSTITIPYIAVGAPAA